MLTGTMKGKRTAALAISLAVLGITACTGGEANAMAKGPLNANAPAAPIENTVDAARVAAGTYSQGYQLGRRNGDIISDRLRDRIVGTEGCRAIHKLQDSLVKVTRTIRPPLGIEDALVRGFYRGYLDAVRDAVRDARESCGQRRFQQGQFAGELFGALLCQVSTISIDAVTEFQVEHLYDGWSGNEEDVIGECRTSAQLTLRSCGDRDLTEILDLQIQQSCSDY